MATVTTLSKVPPPAPPPTNLVGTAASKENRVTAVTADSCK